MQQILMPPQIDNMIQSPYHHSNHGGPQSGSSNGSNPPPNYSSSQGQAHAQDGRGKQSSQQQQNSPPNSHNNQMYMQQSQMMGNPPYMGHGHHMQPPPYHVQQQQQGQHISSPHHPQQGPHGYAVPPHNVYHPGPYSPYHMQMHGHHQGSYPPQHPYAMHQSRSGNSSSSSKMGDKDYNESNNGFNSKGGPVVAITKKTMKDNFSAPSGDIDPVLKVEPMKSDFFFFLEEMKKDVMAEAKKEVLRSITSPLKDLESDLAELQMDDGEDPHPYLLYSKINENMMAKWEQLPQNKRSDYLILEEVDRKRFMSADEVASRHCATLTARSRSPQPFTPKNKDKGKLSENQKSETGRNNEKETRSPSPAATLSVSKMLQTEGEKKDMDEKRARSSSEVNDEKNRDEDLGESPIKKIKRDPIEEAKKLYGDFVFSEEKHGNLSKQELLDLAENIPNEASENSSNADGDLQMLKGEREKYLDAAEKASKDTEVKIKIEANETADEKKKEVSPDEFNDEVDDLEHEEAMEVELLLDRRIRQVRGRRVKEYLVRWRGHDKESDSWEPYKNVEHCEEMLKEIDEKKRIEKENATKPSVKKE